MSNFTRRARRSVGVLTVATAPLLLPVAHAGAATVTNAKLAFLMPDESSTRYEEHDKPGFIAEVKTLCPSCTVLYQNADGDAARQQQQFNSVVSQGAKAIVLDPVDSTAAASLVNQAQSQGIKVIAYDRPIPSAKASYYVSFNNEQIGRMIAQSLVSHLKATGAKGGVLEVNGSPTDAAAGLIRKGIHEGRGGGGAAKDGTAGGVSGGGTAAGRDQVPPVTGNDATIAGLQLIIAGDQYNTISKPSEIVAAAAAKVAIGLLGGETPQSTTTLFNTPTQLFTPTLITAENLKSEIVEKQVNGKPIESASVLCTGRYAAGCQKLGISQ